MKKFITDQFLELYLMKEAPWTNTFWRGHQVAKCPLDLWVYQEIIFETKPNLVIETGTCIGGSAYFFATLFDLIGEGQVITVDIDHYPNVPSHPRIKYLIGDSVSIEVLETIKRYTEGRRIMVALDSDHGYAHVKRELELYSPFVTSGCYVVIEDTTVDKTWQKPGARAAAREFVERSPDFEIDRSREKHLLTFNPDGWIRRK